MKTTLIVSALMLCGGFGLALLAVGAPLRTVAHVDLQRYLGTWYEIATIPARFQKNCVGVTATYAMRPDGAIGVVNRCRKFTLDGKEKSVKGKAWVVDTSSNAKLKVQFFWPFRGDYWIIELDPEYQYAVVGHPSRNYLWILCRRPHMDEALYNQLVDKIAAQGYDVNRLVKTLQPAGDAGT
jgi:apolipoprotein D and lipocalin family protein